MHIKKLLIILFLVSNCGSIPDIHYYVIDIPYKSTKTEDARHQIVLGIEKLEADPLYEQDRLIYRDSPHEIKFYNYHRWISPPREIVTAKLIEQFSTSGLFKQVVSYPRIGKIDYLLRGTLKTFEEWDKGDDWYAYVKLHFELMNMENNNLVWQDLLTKKTRVTQKKPIEVVRAIGISLQACIKEALNEIDHALKTKVKKN